MNHLQHGNVFCRMQIPITVHNVLLHWYFRFLWQYQNWIHVTPAINASMWRHTVIHIDLFIFARFSVIFSMTEPCCFNNNPTWWRHKNAQGSSTLLCASLDTRNSAHANQNKIIFLWETIYCQYFLHHSAILTNYGPQIIHWLHADVP